MRGKERERWRERRERREINVECKTPGEINVTRGQEAPERNARRGECRLRFNVNTWRTVSRQKLRFTFVKQLRIFRATSRNEGHFVAFFFLTRDPVLRAIP